MNAGRDISYFSRPNARGQFFRHQHGQQRDNCLLIAARLAALQLLFERGEIEVPAPRRSATFRGVSGDFYVAKSVGERQFLRVRYQAWIDRQSAKLTLADGRVVLLQLESEIRSSEGAGVGAD